MIVFTILQFSTVFSYALLFPFLPFMVQFLLPDIEYASVGTLNSYCHLSCYNNGSQVTMPAHWLHRSSWVDFFQGKVSSHSIISII